MVHRLAEGTGALASDDQRPHEGTMITLETTANGIRLTRDGQGYTATSPATAAVLIRRLIRPAPASAAAVAPTPPAPASPGAQLGQRLAAARRRYLPAPVSPGVEV